MDHDEKFDFVFGGALRKHNIPDDVNNDLNFELGIRFGMEWLKERKINNDFLKALIPDYAWLYHQSNGEVLGIGSDNHEDNTAGVGYRVAW